MLKKLTVLLLLVICFANVTIAQEDNPVQLRMMSLAFGSEGSPFIAMQIDDAIVFESLIWPFATPYIELAPGEHTLTASLIENEDAVASTDLDLEPDGRYTVIVEGDYRDDTVRFVVVDETDLPLDETGSAAIVVNLATEPVDYIVNDDILLTGVPAGEYRSAPLPQTSITTAVTFTDNANETPLSQGFDLRPNLTLLTVVRLSDSGDLQRFTRSASTATIADYVLGLEGAIPFADAIANQLNVATTTTETGAYTLFVPTGDAIAELGDAIPTSQDALEALVANHITLSDLPPYELVGRESLDMLSGNTAMLQFGETESGWWEIEGAPIWSNIRFADGIVYIIDGVIAP